MAGRWKDGEVAFCLAAAEDFGVPVSRDPKTFASYLRLQAAAAYRDGQTEISAALGVAATCVNEDARNNHSPRWRDAVMVLEKIKDV